MSCFLIYWCGARANERKRKRVSERESVRACVVGRSVGLSVPWGRCVFSLLLMLVFWEREGENWREGPAQSAGDRRKVPRKYEQEEVLSFSFVQTPCGAHCVDFCALSHVICERAREWGSSQVQRCAVCSTLCNASPHIRLLLLPPAAFSLEGVVFWQFVGCWGFVGNLERRAVENGDVMKKALLLKEEQEKRNRKEREWETTQNDAEIREQKERQTKN